MNARKGLTLVNSPDLYDEFGELDRQIQAFKPVLDRYEKLKAQIKAEAEEYPADQDFTISGKLYDLQISAKANERKIVSMRRVYKAVGSLKGFLEICTVALKALEEKLGKDAVAGLVEEGRTGSRRIKAVARVAAQQHQQAA